MPEQTVPVSAPIDTDSAGRGGDIAQQSVFRVICPDTNSSGTGFLHHSGNVITAEHVIRGSKRPHIIFSNGTGMAASIAAQEKRIDLALLRPSENLTAKPLIISSAADFAIGTQVSTWGYPGGYSGALPMLSVGYLAGMSGLQTASGEVTKQWVVNAAFNSGNSGGPLLHIETGEVMGVVSSKLAPISAQARSALTALENQKSGFMYTATQPDGTQIQVSEGQIVAGILNELRQQVQLVIGMAVLLADITAFLAAQGAKP